MRSISLLLAGCTVAAITQRLPAQEPPRLPQGFTLGGSMDLFTYEGSRATAFTFRGSSLAPGGLGPEVGVSLFPGALPARAVMLAPDVGLAYNLALPYATLLIKAGGSALTAVAPGGAAFIAGYHLGAGLVLQLDRRTGVRFDVIRHSYIGFDEAEAVWSIGLGFTVLPRRR